MMYIVNDVFDNHNHSAQIIFHHSHKKPKETLETIFLLL